MKKIDFEKMYSEHNFSTQTNANVTTRYYSADIVTRDEVFLSQTIKYLVWKTEAHFTIMWKVFSSKQQTA